jgi:hypothetical protein
MSQNRLEIKITTDVDDQHVNIKAMSLKAAQSFLLLFESITKIVELTPGNKDTTIQITPGSVVVAAEGESIIKAKKEFDKIVENRSTNKELVEQWRRIQGVFSANGLQYEANFYTGGHKTTFFKILKDRQKLRTKAVVKKFSTELEFITGKLIAVGGKHPNIHVEVNGKILPPVSCTEGSATKAKAYLYQPIRFSAWAKKGGNLKKYTLCDSYANESIYNELDAMVRELFELEEVEALKQVHYYCRSFLDRQDYGNFRKFMRLFIHESTDINILKMILVATQSVGQNEKLKPMIDDLKLIFDKQFRIQHKKLSV